MIGILDNSDIPPIMEVGKLATGLLLFVPLAEVFMNTGVRILNKIATPTIHNSVISIADLIVLKLCVKKTLNDIIYKIHKAKYKYSGFVNPDIK